LLGFPDSLYEEHFGGRISLAKAKAQQHPLEFSTPYYVECEIAKGMNKSLEEYQKLSRRERLVWYYHRILAAEKEQHQYDEIKRKSDAQAAKPQEPSLPRHIRR
jgi:hypothetical protein